MEETIRFEDNRDHNTWELTFAVIWGGGTWAPTYTHNAVYLLSSIHFIVTALSDQLPS